MELYNRVRDAIGLETGTKETALPGVGVFYSESPTPRVPLIYDSGIILICSGRKSVFLADKTYTYDADNYLVVGLPVALECEGTASREEPIFGLWVKADISMLNEISATASLPPSTERQFGLEAVPTPTDLRDATQRLLAALCNKDDTAVLGPGLKREILYRVLADRHGAILQSLINRDGSYARVAGIMRLLNEDCSTRRSVQEMARAAGMSESAFHRAFKETSGDTPLQYQKKVRLMRAGTLLVHEKQRVSSAAFAVGYESAAQFSRDFKRYFGINAADARRNGQIFSDGERSAL